MQRNTFFQSECLPEWNVWSQVYADGSGRGMEIKHTHGNLLRFIYSSRHQSVYLQWIGYSDHTMSALKDITKWHSIFWSVEAQNRNKHDCVACEFTAKNMNLLIQSLNLIDAERPLGEMRNQIYAFLAACNLEVPPPAYSYACEFPVQNPVDVSVSFTRGYP